MLLNATTESDWCIFGTTELPNLSFEEGYKRARAKLATMSKEEKQELARQAFGMWKDRDDLPY